MNRQPVILLLLFIVCSSVVLATDYNDVITWGNDQSGGSINGCFGFTFNMSVTSNLTSFVNQNNIPTDSAGFVRIYNGSVAGSTVCPGGQLSRTAFSGHNATLSTPLTVNRGDTMTILCEYAAQGSAYDSQALAFTNNGSTGLIHYIADASAGGFQRCITSIRFTTLLNPTSISWGTNLSNVSQNWNTSIVLRANATNTTADCALQNYTTNNTLIPINSTSGLINISAFNSSLANKTTTVLVSATDNCSDTITQVVSLNVSYHAPNISVQISPSPTGTANNLFCNVTISNPDGQATSTFYRWYKNNTENTSYQNLTTIGKGNLTISDHWVCSPSTNDTLTTISFTNSTILVLGDSSPPSWWAYTLSTTSATVSQTIITFDVNWTDNENIGTVLLQITDPNSINNNYTMTPAGGNWYEFNYSVGGTPGTYQTLSIGLDGSNNRNQTSISNFTASSQGGGGNPSSGSGGGSVTVTPNPVAGVCSFSILQPVNGIVSNPLCPPGETSNDQPITIQNNLLTPTEYHLGIPGGRCQTDPSSLTLAGGQKGIIMLTNCTCPTTPGIAEDVNISVIQTSTICSQQFTLDLTASNLGKYAQSPAYLLFGFLVLFLLALLLAVVILAIIRRRKR
jgi:hypothetical protein